MAVITRIKGNEQTTHEYRCASWSEMDDWAGAMSRCGWIMTVDTVSWVGTRNGEYVIATFHD